MRPLGGDRGAERLGEGVDLLQRAPLGDRDQQAVLVLRILAAERVAGGNASLRAALQDRVNRGIETHRELAGDGRLVQQLDSLDRGQLLSRVGGPPHQQLAELAEALAPEPGEVNHRAERVQRLRGADVVGRFLAADVLLAGLQCEDEAAATVDVLGFAGDPSRHPPDLLLSRAEEAEGGAAEVEPVAERLALTEGDVGAASAGRLRIPRVIGSQATTNSASCSLAAAPSASTSSTAPRKFGFCRKTAAVSPSTAAASAAASVSPPSSPTSTISAPKPLRVGRQRLAAVRVEAAGDDEAPPPGRGHRQVAGGGDR